MPASKNTFRPLRHIQRHWKQCQGRPPPRPDPAHRWAWFKEVTASVRERARLASVDRYLRLRARLGEISPLLAEAAHSFRLDAPTSGQRKGFYYTCERCGLCTQLAQVAQKPCRARDPSVSATAFPRAVMPAATFERWQAARKASADKQNASRAGS
eukprot:9778834-Alexandrium_andersonii.AAC.1